MDQLVANSAATQATRPVSANIRCINLRYSYTVPRGNAVLALDDITFDAREREFLAFLGPSGCGKSTLLYLIGGFIPIEHGQLLIGDKPIRGPGPDRGITFQHFALFPWKTVRQNILYGLEKKRMPRPEREARVLQLIKKVQLTGFENAYPSHLSGGMKQRVAIARMLAVDPAILLMDEPFGALDAQTRELLQEELLGLVRRTPKTVVFVTHDVREAVYLADRVAVMSARPGRIKEIVEINRSHIGDAEFVRTREYADKVAYLRQLVRDEAIRAQEYRE